MTAVGPVEALDLVIIGDGPEQYDLTADMALDVVPHRGDVQRPLTYQVYRKDESNHRSALGAFTPPLGIFETELVVDRYASQLAALAPGDGAAAADAFRDAVHDLGEAYRDGRLFIVENAEARLIRSTASVEYQPGELHPWAVTFHDEETTNTFGYVTEEFTESEWLGESNPTQTHLPSPADTDLHPRNNAGRWARVRGIWQAMAALEESEH